MSINVRHAQDLDVEWILLELVKFSTFLNTRIPSYGDENYSRSKLMDLIQNHVVFVAENETGPVGFIAGIVTPHFFNPEITLLAELFWWVSEDHRNSRAGLMLLNKYVEWGKENADWVTIALEEVTPVNERSLTKRGFKMHERSYLMECT